MSHGKSFFQGIPKVLVQLRIVLLVSFLMVQLIHVSTVLKDISKYKSITFSWCYEYFCYFQENEMGTFSPMS